MASTLGAPPRVFCTVKITALAKHDTQVGSTSSMASFVCTTERCLCAFLVTTVAKQTAEFEGSESMTAFVEAAPSGCVVVNFTELRDDLPHFSGESERV